ncbi:TasA family protein [Actinorugispora endophytica]|uniref:TasA family protein n=1 Tax=Actinorugispora endophytica TaxID=1605990 RepID=UPI00105B8ED9|nr:TasA family protein [Actinorugispora endophytica]
MATSKSRKLIAGLGAAAVIGAAVAITGGTYAYFTDSAQTPEQTITAGDLTVLVGQNGSGPADKPVRVQNAAPGEVYVQDLTHPWFGEDWYRMRVTNDGSIDGEINSLEITELAGSTPNLADRLQIRAVVKPLDWEPGSWEASSFESLDTGALTSLPGDRTLLSGESTYIYFQIQWPNGTPEEDNPYKNATTSFTFQVNLDQKNQGR